MTWILGWICPGMLVLAFCLLGFARTMPDANFKNGWNDDE